MQLLDPQWEPKNMYCVNTQQIHNNKIVKQIVVERIDGWTCFNVVLKTTKLIRKVLRLWDYLVFIRIKRNNVHNLYKNNRFNYAYLLTWLPREISAIAFRRSRMWFRYQLVNRIQITQKTGIEGAAIVTINQFVIEGLSGCWDWNITCLIALIWWKIWNI